MTKLYYSISEVSKMIDEEQYILRYWEKEFKSLKPKKNSAGNRKYSLKDIEILKQIKDLLRDSEMNLITAREIVDNNKKLDKVSLINNRVEKDRTTVDIDKELFRETLDTLKNLSAILKQI